MCVCECVYNYCFSVCVCVSRRWQECSSKWQKFVSDQNSVEEGLNNAESTLKLAESEPAAHRQKVRVMSTCSRPNPYHTAGTVHRNICPKYKQDPPPKLR